MIDTLDLFGLHPEDVEILHMTARRMRNLAQQHKAQPAVPGVKSSPLPREAKRIRRSAKNLPPAENAVEMSVSTESETEEAPRRTSTLGQMHHILKKRHDAAEETMKLWCEQCQKRVAEAAAEACASKWCGARIAFEVVRP